MDALQKDLYLLATSLMQLVLLLLLSLVAPDELNRGEGEIPLPREIVASLRMPRYADWVANEHPLPCVIDQLVVVVELDGEELCQVDVDPALGLATTEIAEGTNLVVTVDPPPFATSRGPDALVTITVRHAFVDTSDALPRKLALIAGFEVVGSADPVRRWWQALARAADEGTLESPALDATFDGHAIGRSIVTPENTVVEDTLGWTAWMPGGTLDLDTRERSAWADAQPPSVMADIRNAGLTGSGPVPAGPLAIRYEVGLEPGEEDDGGGYVAPKIACRCLPTLSTP